MIFQETARHFYGKWQFTQQWLFYIPTNKSIVELTLKTRTPWSKFVNCAKSFTNLNRSFGKFVQSETLKTIYAHHTTSSFCCFVAVFNLLRILNNAGQKWSTAYCDLCRNVGQIIWLISCLGNSQVTSCKLPKFCHFCSKLADACLTDLFLKKNSIQIIS